MIRPFRAFALLLTAIAAMPMAAAAEPAKSELFLMTSGGQLYDGWYNALGVEPPKATHPSYPASGKQKGAATWRCKECHGWDYKGKDGAYAKGSHYTGIKGIRALEGAAPAKLVAIIRNRTHRYTKGMIPDDAAQNLALFVAKGQFNMDKYIDPATGKPKGDAKRGAGLYQTACAVCHGLDGRQLNFKTPPKVEYIGTVAKANPWEVLHKIRNGPPRQIMPGLSGFPMQNLLDIISYAQTLPAK